MSTSLLPVSWRRALGMTVNGPKPGFKRSMNGLVSVHLDSTPSDLNNLTINHGVLIPAPYWQAEHKTANAFQVAIRAQYPTRRFSIRTARARGGRWDVLIIRTA